MIITADTQRCDTPALEMLRRVNTDVPILLISRSEELNFNEEILSLAGKKYVVADFIEAGWNAELTETLIVGENTHDFDYTQKGGWSRLHDFMVENKPALYFKRELLAKDKTETILPIEYPNWQADYHLQLREDFEKRPIAALNYWGRSHEARLLLQGDIWRYAAKKGGAVCDNIYHLNGFLQHDTNPLKFVTLNIEHYSRIDISEIMKVNQMSKLSISIFGCGRKCFRNTGESIVNSICVLPEDELAYSYPFEHNKNCIKFSINNDVTGLQTEWDVMGAVEKALQNPNLYDIYLESKKIADWYRIDNYTKNYLNPLINNA
jgi:hypothetical protein